MTKRKYRNYDKTPMTQNEMLLKNQRPENADLHPQYRMIRAHYDYWMTIYDEYAIHFEDDSMNYDTCNYLNYLSNSIADQLHYTGATELSDPDYVTLTFHNFDADIIFNELENLVDVNAANDVDDTYITDAPKIYGQYY